jgi:uncharacterized membrane protein
LPWFDITPAASDDIELLFQSGGEFHGVTYKGFAAWLLMAMEKMREA